MSSEPPQRVQSLRGKGSSLVVRNFQRRHPVDGPRLSAFLTQVASAIGEHRSATLALVTDSRIQRLNRDFRGFDKPTDVLSFPSGDAEGELTPGAPGGEDYLGDIVISVETAERQARRLHSTLVRELEILTLHGFLHLLGYDHQTDGGEMRRIEYRLRRRFGIRRTRSLQPERRASGASP
ncbi:MAG: rRNA maturation RNase YbeY, partial [Vicinamibacteria bacterium]